MSHFAVLTGLALLVVAGLTRRASHRINYSAKATSTWRAARSSRSFQSHTSLTERSPDTVGRAVLRSNVYFPPGEPEGKFVRGRMWS
jgi:hypothetical protein